MKLSKTFATILCLMQGTGILAQDADNIDIAAASAKLDFTCDLRITESNAEGISSMKSGSINFSFDLNNPYIDHTPCNDWAHCGELTQEFEQQGILPGVFGSYGSDFFFPKQYRYEGSSDETNLNISIILHRSIENHSRYNMKFGLAKQVSPEEFEQGASYIGATSNTEIVSFDNNQTVFAPSLSSRNIDGKFQAFAYCYLSLAERK